MVSFNSAAKYGMEEVACSSIFQYFGFCYHKCIDCVQRNRKGYYQN